MGVEWRATNRTAIFDEGSSFYSANMESVCVVRVPLVIDVYTHQSENKFPWKTYSTPQRTYLFEKGVTGFTRFKTLRNWYRVRTAFLRARSLFLLSFFFVVVFTIPLAYNIFI